VEDQKMRVGRRDLAHLISQATRVPGTDTETLSVGVPSSDFEVFGIEVKLGPEELLHARRSLANR
jgi:hypothetical protein